MIKQEITCDNCQRDLSKTSNCVDYRLRLSEEWISPNSGFVTSMMIYPSLKDGDCHFCGLGCLKAWVLSL